MLIGLSASLCISDIVEGKVDIVDVAYIISGIRHTVDGDDALHEVLDRYKNTCWSVYPTAAYQVFSTLFNASRILFPRDEHDSGHDPLLNLNSGHWLACEQVNRVEEAFSRTNWMTKTQEFVNENVDQVIMNNDDKLWWLLHTNPEGVAVGAMEFRVIQSGHKPWPDREMIEGMVAGPFCKLSLALLKANSLQRKFEKTLIEETKSWLDANDEGLPNNNDPADILMDDDNWSE